jgi:hypothetical protein
MKTFNPMTIPQQTSKEVALSWGQQVHGVSKGGKGEK